jgi:hypothetical protein
MEGNWIRRPQGEASAGALTDAALAKTGERNTNLRSAPPSHAATADGCVVKHKIECIGNSDGTFHLEAGAQVRQVEDRTIDRRPAALKGDACSLESAAGASLGFLQGPALGKRTFYRQIGGSACRSLIRS